MTEADYKVAELKRRLWAIMRECEEEMLKVRDDDHVEISRPSDIYTSLANCFNKIRKVLEPPL